MSWRMVMAMLFLGVGGIGFSAWWLNDGFLKDFKGQLRVLPLTLHDTLGGWIEEPGSAKSHLESYPKAISPVQSTELSGEAGPASAADLRILDLPIENQDSRLASGQTEGTGDNDTSSAGGRDNNDVGPVATLSEMTGWREQPITVQSGSTVAEIAARIYGTQKNLGLDLIKEYNTHIENLNRIIAGQRLWLPPLSRETLVRQQPDGSYGLILTSLRNPQQAAQLAQIARLKGYDVVVTPRRVGDDFIVYRVEINGLKDVDAVDQAWGVALANQWIASADHSAGKRF
jgi:hypothetical protein